MIDWDSITKNYKGFCGRIAQRKDEKLQLMELCRGIDLYLEIGTLWGGTAIIAAIAGAKKVITIDSMDTAYWQEFDPGFPEERLTRGRVLRNIYDFGLQDIIEVITAPSFPFPVENVYPDVVLIDGDHGDRVARDWESVRGITKHFVLFHDYKSPNCPAVTHTVDHVVRKDPNWGLWKVVEYTAVMRRTIISDIDSMCYASEAVRG